MPFRARVTASAMHPLSESLTEVLLQNGVQVVLNGAAFAGPERAIVLGHDKREHSVRVRRTVNGGVHTDDIKLDKIPFRIAVSNETAIQCR